MQFVNGWTSGNINHPLKLPGIPELVLTNFSITSFKMPRNDRKRGELNALHFCMAYRCALRIGGTVVSVEPPVEAACALHGLPGVASRGGRCRTDPREPRRPP